MSSELVVGGFDSRLERLVACECVPCDVEGPGKLVVKGGEVWVFGKYTSAARLRGRGGSSCGVGSGVHG